MSTIKSRENVFTTKTTTATARKRGRRRRNRKKQAASPSQQQKKEEKQSGDLSSFSHFVDFYLYNEVSSDFATCNVESKSFRNMKCDVLTSGYLRDIVSKSNVSSECLSTFILNRIVSKIMLFHQNKNQVLNESTKFCSDSASEGCDIDSNSNDNFVVFNEFELDLELGIAAPGIPGNVEMNRSRSIGDSAYSLSVSPSTDASSVSPPSSGSTLHQCQPQQTRDPQEYNPYTSMDIQSIIRSKLEIYELVEYRLVYRMMRDQFGSRYLQNMIKSLSAMHKQSTHHITLLMNHLIAEGVDLCLMSEDIYGNYLIQLLFVHGNDSHHELLLNYFVYKSTLRLCRSKYGCRVIQKILSTVKNVDRLIQLVQCFNQQTVGNIHQCLLACNTNHVIQAIIDLKLPFQHLKFIKDALESKIVDYSDNVYACRVVQAFIKAYGDQLDVGKLCLNDNHLFLARSKYGNYVIQCIVTKDLWYSNLAMINKFRNNLICDAFAAENILFLSKNKFGSNVIETAIEVSNEKQLDILINTICSQHGFLLKQMISDKFANYVPKTLLDNCYNKRQQMQLVNAVHLYITNLYTRHGYRNCSGFIQKCQQIMHQTKSY